MQLFEFVERAEAGDLKNLDQDHIVSSICMYLYYIVLFCSPEQYTVLLQLLMDRRTLTMLELVYGAASLN